MFFHTQSSMSNSSHNFHRGFWKQAAGLTSPCDAFCLKSPNASMTLSKPGFLFKRCTAKRLRCSIASLASADRRFKRRSCFFETLATLSSPAQRMKLSRRCLQRSSAQSFRRRSKCGRSNPAFGIAPSGVKRKRNGPLQGLKRRRPC